MYIYLPGSRIDRRYEVASRPLMGGMGIVYLCHDHTDKRPVALKTFRPEFLPDRAARDRFLREGDTWMKLGKHPHIVQAYQVVRVGDGTEVFLVLELIAKEQGRQDASLRSWLTPGQLLPPAQALLFAMQILRGMQHATATIPGFVHRDLKPENLLVGSDKLTNADIHRLRVTDLGLASVLGELHGMGKVDENDASAFGRTQLTHGIVGTPLYMAPEQWHSETVSTATDIYALGCIVFEMLAGERVVTGGSLAALETAHVRGQHRTLPATLPVSLRQWVERCLAVSPKERYAHWAEAEAGLQEAYVAVTGRTLPESEAVQQLARAERVAAGWARSEIGGSYLDIGKAAVAKEYFERATEVGQREGEKGLEAGGLNGVGSAYLNLGDAHHAIGYFEQALTIAREIGNRRGEGYALGNLGSAYLNLGDARRAIGYYEEALAIARAIGDRHGQDTVLGNLGNAYATLGDARRAIGYYEQDLAIAREIGNRRGEGYALGNLGGAYAALGDARRAIGYYEQALVIHREIGDRHSEGSTLGNLGQLYRNSGDLSTGLVFSKQALTVFREIGARKEQAEELSLQGGTHAKMGDLQNAVICWRESLRIAEEIGSKLVAGNCSYKIATLLVNSGDLEEALSLAQKALQYYLEIERFDWSNDARNLVRRIQTQKDSVGQQANVAQQAFETFQSTESLDEIREAVARFPFMTDPQFIRAVQQVIAHQEPSQLKLALEQKLEWLIQIQSWQGNAPTGGGTANTNIHQQFGQLIGVVALGARGDKQARNAVEQAFPQLQQGGFQIIEPIKQIWKGERNESKLTRGLDETDSFIIREILKQL